MSVADFQKKKDRILKFRQLHGQIIDAMPPGEDEETEIFNNFTTTSNQDNFTLSVFSRPYT